MAPAGSLTLHIIEDGAFVVWSVKPPRLIASRFVVDPRLLPPWKLKMGLKQRLKELGRMFWRSDAPRDHNSEYLGWVICPRVEEDTTSEAGSAQSWGLRSEPGIPSVFGKVHCGTAHRYGKLTADSAIFRVEQSLRDLITPATTSLDTSQKGHGIESLNWERTQQIFDLCDDLCCSTEEVEHERHIELSSDQPSVWYRPMGDISGDVIEQFQKLVNDDDVLKKLSFTLEDAAGHLVDPADVLDTEDSDVTPCENRFLDISVTLYPDLHRPCIKVSRLYLVVCTRFSHKDRPPISWHITGAYNSSVYLPKPELFMSLCEHARRLGQQEIQKLIPRKQPRARAG